MKEIIDEATLEDRGFVKEGNAMFFRSYEQNVETRFIEVAPRMYQFDGKFPIVEDIPMWDEQGNRIMKK